MTTLVKVRKWGNSLGVRLPRSFAREHDIVDGSTLAIDNVKRVDSRPRRRSNYKLKNLLRNYRHPPKHLEFLPVGKETL